MTGLWVALSVMKSAREIRILMENWFPKLVTEDWHLEQADGNVDSSLLQHPDILFRVEYNSSEFPTAIHFDAFPGPQDEAVIMRVMIELARRFANAFGCRTICDGSGYGDSQSPYWDIIWEGGRSFLADDCDTLFADQTGGAVRVIRQLDLPKIALDDAGRLVTGT
jgi:hypothetical protein